MVCTQSQNNSTTTLPAHSIISVLGRFVHALNQYRRDHHDLEYDVADYHIYDFATVWECSPDESSHIVHEFFKSRHFLEGIPVIPGVGIDWWSRRKQKHTLALYQPHAPRAPTTGAQTSLQALSDTYDLVVVTSRQHVIREPTLQWLETHFPGTFVDVHFGNHYALSGPSMSKSEICKQVGAQVLIDDNPRYAMECAQAGIQVLLFDWDGSYAWSKTSCGYVGVDSKWWGESIIVCTINLDPWHRPTHPLITRVHSWAHVEKTLALVGADYQP